MDNYTNNFTECCFYTEPPSQKTNATNWSECESRGPCLYPQNGIQPSLGYSLGESTSTRTSDEEVSLSVMAGTKNKIKAELKNIELWNVFREKETEMIITRAGRYVGLDIVASRITHVIYSVVKLTTLLFIRRQRILEAFL